MNVRVLIVFLCFGCLWAATAYATLGEKVEAPRGTLLAIPSTSASPSSMYSVHESVSNGTQIKEFADSSDIVFAVGWNGPHHPDLQKLFGKHFASFKAAQNRAKTGSAHTRGTLEVKASDIVVRVGGHMGAVRGFAYVPSLVPQGVSVEDLK